MSAPDFLLLRHGEARRLLSSADAIAAIEAAWHDYGHQRQVLSRPSSMGMGGGGAVFKIKGGILTGQGVAGFRLVADHWDTAGRELTEDWFWLADPATGRPLALIEEFGLHCLRTAVTGAVAAGLLAKPGTRSLGLVGAGQIARELLEPLRQVLPGLERVRVSSRRLASAEDFARRYTIPGLVVEAVATPEEAVAGADLVMTLSAAELPFLRPEHLAPGATVIGMGGDAELDASVLGWADRFVVDDMDFACVAGSVAGWLKSGALTREAVVARLDADIGEVAAGLKPGRRAAGENVVAIIQGMAVCDLALATLAWRHARASGAGQSLPLGEAAP
ncbi:MAG: hypothetical protein JWP20_2492 [Roseomonas sp.]|jgi:ornithine cyclodeaminase/alanine dehydrogenase-like protein (mu-crystallin family)|nr:hypothetical protein [Roseomonas sp.]